MSCLVLSCLVKKACCTCKVVVFPKKPIAVLTFSLPSPSPSPSSLLKLPINLTKNGPTDSSVPWLIGTKHFPESKTRTRIQKHVRESKSILDTGTCFGFDSGKRFWILGNVLSLRYHILISYPWVRAISWILYSLDWAQCKVNT